MNGRTQRGEMETCDRNAFDGWCTLHAHQRIQPMCECVDDEVKKKKTQEENYEHYAVAAKENGGANRNDYYYAVTS